MRKPTLSQIYLLARAHHNGGRLPANSFARYGVYPLFRGAEHIHTVLAAAARIRNDVKAVQHLCAELSQHEILMAGGFLGVDRTDTDAPGTLADRYVTAIRAGRIARVIGAKGYITPATLHACQAAGWFDDRWMITPAGRAAAQLPDPAAPAITIEVGQDSNGIPFGAPIVPSALPAVPWRSPGSRGAGKSNLMHLILDGLAKGMDLQIIDGKNGTTETHTADSLLRRADAAAADVAIPGVTVVREEVAPAFMWAAGQDPVAFHPDQVPPPEMIAAVAATLAERRLALDPGSQAVVDAAVRDGRLAQLERDAVARGVPAAVAARLAPPVTGETADALHHDVTVVATTLADAFADRSHLADALRVDSRAPGFRITVHEARTAADQEWARLAAFYLEAALVEIAFGRRSRAERSLSKARAHLEHHPAR